LFVCLFVCLFGVFCPCDQKPDRNNLRKERFILLIISEVSLHHGGEGMVEQFISWLPGSTAVTGRARVRCHLLGHMPSDWLPLTSPIPPNSLFKFEPINGLDHTLGQSLHDLIISLNSLTGTGRCFY
jgi:hypothetical protein